MGWKWEARAEVAALFVFSAEVPASILLEERVLSVLLCMWSSAFPPPFFSVVPLSLSPVCASSVVPVKERKAEDAQVARGFGEIDKGGNR
jgi:hypothetical protein